MKYTAKQFWKKLYSQSRRIIHSSVNEWMTFVHSPEQRKLIAVIEKPHALGRFICRRADRSDVPAIRALHANFNESMINGTHRTQVENARYYRQRAQNAGFKLP